jgi:hypothetical protein
MNRTFNQTLDHPKQQLHLKNNLMKDEARNSSPASHNKRPVRD